MARITIDVTGADIDRGEPACPWACPVANALNRTLPGDWEVEADRLKRRDPDADPDDEAYDLVIPAPPEVEGFVLEYDGGLPVAPFHFELDLPARLYRR